MDDPAPPRRRTHGGTGGGGAGPCQALAAEGGGRKARLYKGQASPATIATGGPMGCSSRPCASAKPLGGRYIIHSKFKRARFAFRRVLRLVAHPAERRLFAWVRTELSLSALASCSG